MVLQEYFSRHIYYKIQKAFLRFLKRQYGAKGKNNECPAPRFPGFEPQYVAMWLKHSVPQFTHKENNLSNKYL